MGRAVASTGDGVPATRLVLQDCADMTCRDQDQDVLDSSLCLISQEQHSILEAEKSTIYKSI